MSRLLVIICLLFAFHESSSTLPHDSIQSQESHHDDTVVPTRKDSSTEHKPTHNSEGGGTEGDIEAQLTKTGSHREVTLKNGVAEEHDGREAADGKVNVVEGEDINPDDESDDDKDEILEENYLLPSGKPWKEERYTSDWLYSETFPGLTAEVHWYCPFYITNAKEPENKRKRAEDKECVTTAQLKYWHQQQGSSTDVLLDTFRITYIPTYVLQETNVLQYIKPHSIEENKVMVNVAFQYHSDITCKQLTYEIQEHRQVSKIKEDKHECKKGDSFTTSSFTTREWVWEADEDDEEDDFNLEAEYDEKDQDEEEEAHRTRPHEYNHGAKEQSGTETAHSNHKLSHREDTLNGHEHGEHKPSEGKHKLSFREEDNSR